MSGQTIDKDRLQLAHDQRTCIVEVCIGDAAAVLGDELIRNCLLDVRDVMDIVQINGAQIRILADSLEDRHHSGLALSGSLCGSAARCESFVDVGQGSDVGTCSLKSGELDRASLQAGLLGDDPAEVGSRAAQLFVAECVDGKNRAAGFADELAVSSRDTLGNRDDDGTLGLRQIFDLFHESIEVEGPLRQIDRVTAGAVTALCQSCSSGQPACVTAHDLNDDDRRLCSAKGLVVTDDLLDGGSDVFACGSISGAVVSDRQIVVDRLGNAHEIFVLDALLSRKIGKHLDGIHGIIAACIKQSVDVIGIHHIQNLLIGLGAGIDLGHFETAGAEERGGRSLEQLNSHGICKIFVKINDTALQKTFDAVNHAINLVITLLLGLIINTADRSVDDSCRAAGLSDYTITLTHSSFSFFKNFKTCCYCV